MTKEDKEELLRLLKEYVATCEESDEVWIAFKTVVANIRNSIKLI